MKAFQITITGGDIVAAFDGGVKELSSLDVSRETWARVIEALGVEILPYLELKPGIERPSLERAANNLVEEAVPEERHWLRRAEVNICEQIVEFITPNGVSVNLAKDAVDRLTVAVHFSRDSKYLATMMLAGFSRRLPQAIPLLAQAAKEWAEAS